MLRQNLDDYLIATEDPRTKGESPWDDYNLDAPPGKLVKT
jgi:hypothetical protein